MSAITKSCIVWGGLLACVSLLGCGNTEKEELQQWMTQQRNQAQPKIGTVAEPKKYVPQGYTQDRAVEPFNSQKLTLALRRESGYSGNTGLVDPELRRRKEALEAFPLDAVTMVGSLFNKGQPVALVRVDNLLYQVRVGNYLGQNYGRVTRVSETELTLREIVQDAAGEWIERPATLQLQEKAK